MTYPKARWLTCGVFCACFGLAAEVHPIVWCVPEIASGHISVGRVKVVHPVQNFDAGLGARLDDVGYVVAGVWSMSDLTECYRERRDKFWNEIDPMVACGREFALGDGYSFDTRVGAQWNYMAGYFDDAKRSYDEWQIAETLKTPYVTPWFAMRNFYWPVAKASWRTGLAHTFVLNEAWSLSCWIWIDGGGERWNQQRFGYRHPERIHRGINSGSARIYLNYRVTSWLNLYGGVTGYTVMTRGIRDELRNNPSDEAKDVYAVATVGVSMRY